jgi:hypothetical protein
MLYRFLLFVFFVGINGLTWAQFKFDFNDSIPVKIGNDTLQFPWAGGLNYVQFSEIDYDYDGDQDLFIFDRSKDNIRLFATVLKNGSLTYSFVENAQQYFPPDTKNRAALVDYDGDGKNDLFTYGIGGVKVFRNVGNELDGIQWQLVSNLLYSDYAGNYSNLYVSSSDIPAYVDVDFDTDLDILTYNIAGERIEYHQNQSMELYGHNDSLIYVLKNECWGKFTEDPNNNSLILNDPTIPCSTSNLPDPQRTASEVNTTPKNTRHAGSTMLAIDIDHSGVYDLVIGDVSHSNLTLVINGGVAPNTNSAMISQDVNFPSNTTAADLAIFPASFYLDVDHDNIKDLLVGANAKGVSQNEKGILYYKNLGTNELPNFSFKTKSFLQEAMIDNGTGSIPVFYDQNKDGLQDLLVANFYRYKDPLLKESNLKNFRNIGTATTPFLTYVEDNFQAFADQGFGLRIVPTFGDIDSDGDEDLFLGLENGTLAYYQNTANSGFPMQLAAPVLNYSDHLGAIISTASYCFPQLFDLNNDGLLDLILGKKTGELMYYQNIGSTTNPSFALINDTLGSIDVSVSTPEGYAAPHFFRWNDTTYLFLGAADGQLHFYSGIDNHIAEGDTFQLISSNYRGIQVEGYSSFFVNDLDLDGKLDLFVGGDLGGIMHYEHNENSVSGISENPQNTRPFLLFPNPTSHGFTLQPFEKQSDLFTLEIQDMQGKKLFVLENFTFENGSVHVDTELPTGLYFVYVFGQSAQQSKGYKLVVQH